MALLLLPFVLASRVRTKVFSFLVKMSLGKAGDRFSVSPPFRFGNLGDIWVGNDVTINRDCWIQTLGRQTNRSPRIEIGSGTTIGMGATISAAQRIYIGENVLLARNVYISDHGHAFEDVHRTIRFQGITAVKDVSIGSETWIGQNACVLPGVNIGQHCVVGANSVVNQDVPDFSVVVGAPARLVRRFDPTKNAWAKV